jgi:hypothetical protein
MVLVPATARAAATLVSIRSCGLLSLVGIAQRPDQVLANGDVGGRDDEQAVFVLQAVVGQWLNMQASSVRGYLDLAGHQPEAVPQGLGYNQPPCLVYG